MRRWQQGLRRKKRQKKTLIFLEEEKELLPLSPRNKGNRSGWIQERIRDGGIRPGYIMAMDQRGVGIDWVSADFLLKDNLF